MKKIDKLTFKNFKFFADEQVFDFDRRNILLYGENGSGKSSLYWGLYTFLQSSIKNDDEVKKYFNKDADENLINKFIDEADKNDAFVSLNISDENAIVEQFKISFTTINTNKSTNTNIKRANSTSDFINYRLLSRFYDFRNSEEINIWQLFKKEILDYITIDGENLQNSWSSLKDGLSKRANKYPPIHSQTYKDFQTNLALLNEKMKTFLENIVGNTNTLLSDNFKENISINIEYINSTYNDFVEGSTTRRNRLVKKPKIILKVKFNHKELFRPHTFLNEAKLTAIALSLRFAILKTRLVSEDILKILVLDDLLISLDMSHRLEVIDIILNDEDLQEYQKIILTHDRSFFEMAKHKFNYRQRGKWKYFEMYVDSTGNFEKPLIHKESLSYLEKAEKYFYLNEYEVAGNFLRKEAENFCKDFLSKKEECNFDLGQLINESISLVNNAGVDDTLFKELDHHRKFVLNPRSHDNYEVPTYKSEIESALNTLKELRKIRNEPFLERGKELKFELVTEDKVDTYTFEIKLEDDFRILTIEGQDSVISKGKITYWVMKNGLYTKGTKDKSETYDTTTLKKFYDSNYGKSDKSKNSNFWETISIKDTGEPIKSVLNIEEEV